MAFTYDDALPTDRDQLRLNIADTVENSGPLPASGNFSDGELDALLSAEGSVGRATARCYEILSASWASTVDRKTGQRSESGSQTAAHYAVLAAALRTQHGLAGGAGTAGTIVITKVDGYSNDIAFDED